jgi:hypothetical protein
MCTVFLDLHGCLAVDTGGAAAHPQAVTRLNTSKSDLKIFFCGWDLAEWLVRTSDSPCCSRNCPEPVFVNILRSPGIDSQPGRPVRQPYLSYLPARLHGLAESIPGLHKRLQIRALGSIRASSDTVESEGRRMKQCWMSYIKNKTFKKYPRQKKGSYFFWQLSFKIAETCHWRPEIKKNQSLYSRQLKCEVVTLFLGFNHSGKE